MHAGGVATCCKHTDRRAVSDELFARAGGITTSNKKSNLSGPTQQAGSRTAASGVAWSGLKKRHAQEKLDPRPLYNQHPAWPWAVPVDADPPDPLASCSHPRATPHRSPKASIAPFIILMKVSVDGFALRGGSGSRGG